MANKISSRQILRVNKQQFSRHPPTEITREKDIGVIFDIHLSCDGHINAKVKTANMMATLVRDHTIPYTELLNPYLNIYVS